MVEPICLLDADVDPYELDTTFFASSSYAGGTIWQEESDPIRRKEFWGWYLDQAIPQVLAESDQ